MSSRMKKNSGALKYIVLLILLIVLAVTFYATRENDDTQKPNNNDTPNISDNPIIKPNNQPSDDVNNNPSDSPSDNQSNEDDDTITGSMDNISTDTYIIYDTYVIASENTKYSQSGYKYFIVRSYSEFEKYINDNLQSPFDETFVSSFSSINEQTISNLKQNIDKEFFKSNCLIFVVDYAQKEISGNINNVQITDNTASLYIDRTVELENKSKFLTYIVPINSTSIKSVDINYIR